MPKRKKTVRKQPPALLVLAGIVLVLIAVFAFKGKDDAPSSSAVSLESQLDQALNDGRPTFVFLHSLDCIPCKEMMGVVADVYPSFQESVVLIDVDIYKQGNENIMRREGLQSIPTLVFYDANGKRQMFIGAMSPDKFRDTLTQLAAKQ